MYERERGYIPQRVSITLGIPSLTFVSSEIETTAATKSAHESRVDGESERRTCSEDGVEEDGGPYAPDLPDASTTRRDKEQETYDCAAAEGPAEEGLCGDYWDPGRVVAVEGGEEDVAGCRARPTVRGGLWHTARALYESKRVVIAWGTLVCAQRKEWRANAKEWMKMKTGTAMPATARDVLAPFFPRSRERPGSRAKSAARSLYLNSTFPSSQKRLQVPLVTGGISQSSVYVPIAHSVTNSELKRS